MTWFSAHGVAGADGSSTDNAMVYRRRRLTGAAVCARLGIRRRFIRPGCPWTNGKAERLNRTLLTEYAYARPWTSQQTGSAAPWTSWFGATTLDEPTPPSAADHRSAGSPPDQQRLRSLTTSRCRALDQFLGAGR